MIIGRSAISLSGTYIANPAPKRPIKISSGHGADDLLILPVGMDGTVGMNIGDFLCEWQGPLPPGLVSLGRAGGLLVP